jgi:hypothetical protein
MIFASVWAKLGGQIQLLASSTQLNNFRQDLDAQARHDTLQDPPTVVLYARAARSVNGLPAQLRDVHRVVVGLPIALQMLAVLIVVPAVTSLAIIGRAVHGKLRASR